MNTSILEQYRHYRQYPTAQSLYPIAEAFGLLAYPEPQTGTIGDVRFGQINLNLDAALNHPDRTLKAALYREFTDIGVLREMRFWELQEIEIELFLETIVREWMRNSPTMDAINAGCAVIDIDSYSLYTCQSGGVDSQEDSIGEAFNRALQQMEIECFAAEVEVA